MMDAAREWLLGVTAAAILAALAEGLMQEGGPKRVGRLVCGLVLLAAVFPLLCCGVHTALHCSEARAGLPARGERRHGQ